MLSNRILGLVSAMLLAVVCVSSMGADWLIYQDLDDLIDAVQKGNRSIGEFDCSCFNGRYVTETIDDDYLDKIRKLRNDSAMEDAQDQVTLVGMELHNNA